MPRTSVSHHNLCLLCQGPVFPIIICVCYPWILIPRTCVSYYNLCLLSIIFAVIVCLLSMDPDAKGQCFL